MGQGQGWDLAGRRWEGDGLVLVFGFAGGGGGIDEEGEEEDVVLLWKGVLRRELVRVAVWVVVVWMAVVKVVLVCSCPCPVPLAWCEEPIFRRVVLLTFVLLR